MVEMMKERVSLKRSAPPVSLVECIICQESKKDVLFSATVQGLRSLKESSEERRKLRDTIKKETIDRILSAFKRKVRSCTGTRAAMQSILIRVR